MFVKNTKQKHGNRVLKKVQDTLCRSVKFKMSHTFIQHFEFLKPSEIGLNLFQKHDLHKTGFRKGLNVQKSFLQIVV